MRLGEFEILDLAGNGAMGDVWRAQHPDGTQAAIKVLRGAWRESERINFAREIRAVAALRHPGIVQILDTGNVPEESDNAKIEPGSAWFAMEYADHGTLPTPVESWPEIARYLLDVLDALSYAHARGVIHRDLKPANILVGDRDGHSRAVLTDFGIAQITEKAIGGPDSSPVVDVAGTPLYMAPEQFHGNWRAFGPWTDLYALGCMTFEVLCGEPPFEAASTFALALKHTNEPFPKLTPNVSVPPDLEAWLLRLVQKNPADRFQCAADAAWNLMLLIGSEPEWQPAAGLSAATTSPLPSEPIDTWGTLNFDNTQVLSPTARATMLASDGADVEALPVVFPPIPVCYHALKPAPPMTLRNVGARLFGIRKTAFVDRYPTRSLLWGTLRTINEKDCAQAIILKGQAGVGKTEVARWFTRRARELGASRMVLSTSHSELPNSRDGLPRLLEDIVPIEGLNVRETYQAYIRILTNFGATAEESSPIAAAFAEILHPNESDESVPTVYFENPIQRYRLVVQAMRAVTHSRPLIVWIDDAQWGPDAVGLVEYTMRNPENLKVMFLVTGTNETSWDKRLEDCATITQIDPLLTVDYREFVQDLLPMDYDSVEFLVNRTRGKPLLAKSLVAHWVETDGLIPHASGYQVSEGARGTAVIERVWSIFLDKFLEQFEDKKKSAFRALTLIAAMGKQVDLEEWESASAVYNVNPPDGLIDALEESGHAERNGLNLTIIRAPFFLEVRDRANVTDAWQKAHRACAISVLKESQNGVPVAERRGAHLLQARNIALAVPHFLTAVDELMRQSAYERALEVTERTLDLLTEKGVEEDRRARLMTFRVEALRHQGRFEEAKDAAAKLQLEAQNPGISDSTLAHYHRALGGLHYVTGQDELATDYYVKSAQLFANVDNFGGLAKVWHGLGWFALNLGDFERAEDCYRESAKYASLDGNQLDQAWALQGLADTLFRSGKLENQHAANGLKIATELGAQSCIGMCLISLGDQRTRDGQFSEARIHYEGAEHAFETAESNLVRMVKTRLAMLHLRMGESALAYQEARKVADTGRIALQLMLLPRLILLEAAIGAGAGIENALSDAEQLAKRTEFVHPDLPWLFDRVRSMAGDAISTERLDALGSDLGIPT